MRNFGSEQNSTSKFDVEFLDWIGLFCSDFDFIWSYFDLISLASQLFLQYFDLFEIFIDSEESKNDQTMKIY